MSAQAETFDFQVETRQLLNLMINSVYSDKDLFLRELISNSSDALDKLRVERFRDNDLDADTSDLHIELEVQKDARTLTIRDNGIGMSRDEVVELIGKIANSGTASFVKDLTQAQKEGTGTAELIGRFGVGFYSSFMVADEVTLVTRRAGETEGTRWVSAGEGTYTIEALESAPQGTSVTLHLKPADPDDRLFDYTDPAKIREIVSRYSDFITWPIRMAVPASVTDPSDGADGDENAEVAEPAGQPVAMETINSRKALWARPASEVTDEDYAELYRRISHDWREPLKSVRMQIEGTLQYQALLFLPGHASPDLFSQGVKRGLQLYVNRVFVMDDCEALLPNYLRFVKGVLDSSDLALNVSREILQQDRQIEAMRKRLTRKVLSTVKSMAADEPETYTTFWKEFGRVVKEGLLEDFANRDAILEICSFQSTHDPEATTTLRAYLDRLAERPEGQAGAGETIYYMIGDSRLAIENSPHMEAFAAKGLEVLLLTDPIDDFWPQVSHDYEGKPFRSVTRAGEDLAKLPLENKDADAEQAPEKDTADLIALIKTVLGDAVKDVRASTALTGSAVRLVAAEGAPDIHLERLLRQHGQAELAAAAPVLEINTGHRLIRELAKHAADDNAADTLGDRIWLLLDQARILEGTPVSDAAAFARRLATVLESGI